MRKESPEKELSIKFKFLGDNYSKSEPIDLKDVQKGDNIRIQLFYAKTVQPKMKQIKDVLGGKVLSIDDKELVLECYRQGDEKDTFTRTINFKDLDPQKGTEVYKINQYKKQFLDSEYMEEIGVLRTMISCVMHSFYKDDKEGTIIQPKYNNFTLFNVKDNLFNVIFTVSLTDFIDDGGRDLLINADKLESLLLNTYPLSVIIDPKSLQIEEN